MSGPGRPAGVEVYITASVARTSKGVFHHGDTVRLPKEEAADLKRKGWAE